MKIWVFAAFLVLWGNLLHPLIGSSAVLPGGSWLFVLAGAVLIGASLMAARIDWLCSVSLGLRRAGAARGAAFGEQAAGAIAPECAEEHRLAQDVLRHPAAY